MSRPLFKVAFPMVTLPLHLGGRPAVVFYSFENPKNPNVMFSTLCDSAGTIHQNVAFAKHELLEAMQRPVTFIEARDEEGPAVGGSGLIGPNGRML